MAIFVYPRSSSAAILDFIEPQIAPLDPPTPKTLGWNQTWSRLDAPFARYSPLNYTVTLKLRFGVTQCHESGTIRCSTYDFIFVFHCSNHASIYYRFQDIAAYWSKIATPCIRRPVRGEAVRLRYNS